MSTPPEPESDSYPPPKPALFFRLPAVISLPLILAALLSPGILLAIHPLLALLGCPLIAWAYCKCRYPSGCFGPLWLEMIDMTVIFSHAVVALLGAVGCVIHLVKML